MRARLVTRMKARAILPESTTAQTYDAGCRRCARLAAFLDQVHAENPGYFCRPVPPFGAGDATLELVECRITNAVKCLPPGNKPLPGEIRMCNGFLTADLAALPAGGAILALG